MVETVIAQKTKKALSVLSYRAGLTRNLVKLQYIFRPDKPDLFRILNYHRVNDFNDPFTIDSVAASDFENQMQYISKHYHVLSLEDIYTHITNHHPLPDQCLAITFDDGYEDNYTFAFHTLKKYNLPATIFITVDAVDSHSPLWFDQVLSAFKMTTRKKMISPLDESIFDISTIELKLRTAHMILAGLKKTNNEKKKKYIAELLNELGIHGTRISDNSPYLLTWPRIQEMGQNRISFGSHTMTHPILSILPVPEMEWEIKTSRQIIEQHTGKPVDFIAYPNGKTSDYNESITQTVKQAGYKAALTTEPLINTPATDFFKWGRYKPWQNQVEQFSMALFMHGLS